MRSATNCSFYFALDYLMTHRVLIMRLESSSYLVFLQNRGFPCNHHSTSFSTGASMNSRTQMISLGFLFHSIQRYCKLLWDCQICFCCLTKYVYYWFFALTALSYQLAYHCFFASQGLHTVFLSISKSLV